MRTRSRDDLALLESLEARKLLATFTVDSLADSGPGSLRDAIDMANTEPGADVIEFDASLNGGTITLEEQGLAITDDLDIVGPGSGLLTVTADTTTFEEDFSEETLLSIDSDAISVRISGLTLGDLDPDRPRSFYGGRVTVIRNSGSLELSDVVVRNATNGIVNQGSHLLDMKDSTVEGHERVGISTTDDFGFTAVIRSTVRDNGWGGGGGGVLSSSQLVVEDSTISGNAALQAPTQGRPSSGSSFGGGIRHFNGNLTIRNSTISGNHSGSLNVAYAGGLSVEGGFAEILNSTIVRNSTSNTGDAVVAGVGVHVEGGSLAMSSTIVAYNANDAGLLVEIGGNPLDPASANNLIGDAAFAGGLTGGVNGNIVGAHPTLGVLADNGGPTMTHALLDGSPAIDAGANPLNLTGDQRGMPRVFGASADIGAFELQEGEDTSGTSDRSAGAFLEEFMRDGVAIDVPDNTATSADEAERYYEFNSGDSLVERFRNFYDVQHDYSLTDWGAENYWLQGPDGDVWSVWHGGDVHLLGGAQAGQHRWFLTNLTDATGLSGVSIEPGSISGVLTGWRAFSIQGVSTIDGSLLSIWWSPQSGPGSFIDSNGMERPGQAAGRRGNGWQVANLSAQLTDPQTGDPVDPNTPGFLPLQPFTDSYADSPSLYEPFGRDPASNTGISIVVIGDNEGVYLVSFTPTNFGGSNAWIKQPLADVLDDNGFDPNVFEPQYLAMAGL